jgi:peptidoglycan/xylan/chitin deacetylase (PgdA/CDA1 family)
MNENCPSPRRAPIPILSYHQTDIAPPRGTPYRGLVIPPARFARQMRVLRALGYRGLSMKDLAPYLRGDRSGKVVGITIDDGYVNNFEHALPILQSAGFTATSFVVSGQLGGSNVWDASIGIAPARLMNVPQLRAWLDAGMDVGAHTRNHVDLTECDPVRARAEIVQSRQDLEQALGMPIRSFCYPYGAYREEHVEMARAAGFELATTSDSARVRWDTDLLRLPRVTVWLSTSLPVLMARMWLDLGEGRGLRLPRLRWGRRLGVGPTVAPGGAAGEPTS